jgi:hypothetical protein
MVVQSGFLTTVPSDIKIFAQKVGELASPRHFPSNGFGIGSDIVFSSCVVCRDGFSTMVPLARTIDSQILSWLKSKHCGDWLLSRLSLSKEGTCPKVACGIIAKDILLPMRLAPILVFYVTTVPYYSNMRP